MNKLKIYSDNRKYYSEEFIQGWECGVQNQFDADAAFLEDLLAQIRTEIEQSAIDIALDIIDKCKLERKGGKK